LYLPQHAVVPIMYAGSPAMIVKIHHVQCFQVKVEPCMLWYIVLMPDAIQMGDFPVQLATTNAVTSLLHRTDLACRPS